MAKRLRYSGEFLSRGGTRWRVEIHQESEAQLPSGELTFEAEEPLVIEWENRSKEECLCGSAATIRIESPGDRTYTDLYTTEPGLIRMDVYRENSLYWSGSLDPEFYEEPYEKAELYAVALTFTDFGILDRLKYNLSGVRTLEEILEDAMERSGVLHTGIDFTSYASTCFTDDTPATLDAISVRSENFLDEDGEPMTLYEAVESVLTPLGLRMVQRAGKIWIYDLNGLHANGERRPIQWDGDHQTLGTDKVANNVRITFSAYARPELLSDSATLKGEYSVEPFNRKNELVNEYTWAFGEFYSYEPQTTMDFYGPSEGNPETAAFNLFLGRNGEPVEDTGTGFDHVDSRARYFRMVPVHGDIEECGGLAWRVPAWKGGTLEGSGVTFPVDNALTPDNTGNIVFRTPPVYIPCVQNGVYPNYPYRLRITMEMLMDSRINPFYEAEEARGEADLYDAFKVWTGFVLIPVAIELRDGTGLPLYHYTTHMSDGFGGIGYWKEGAAQYGDAWLAYYNPDDPAESAGIFGWQANKRFRGLLSVSDQEKRYRKNAGGAHEGQLIDFPPCAGYLTVSVLEGVRGFDYGENDGLPDIGHCLVWTVKSLFAQVKWLLYKSPVIEVVNVSGTVGQADMDDVEYTGYLNRSAKEEITLDTSCGTANPANPAALGFYLRASDGQQISYEMKRAGITGRLENLLIGTLYSQYATRHTTLSGEAVADGGGLSAYTERCQPEGRVFMIAGEVQDAVMDCTEATFVELTPDEFVSIEETENKEE